MTVISIIVPIYNVQNSIKDTVKSITEQSFENIEIILVNDGSTDYSLEICEQLAIEDDRIRIIDKKNGGVSSARNLGIIKSTGEYIGFVDAGDTIDKKMYEVLLNNAIEYGADISSCGYRKHTSGKVEGVSLVESSTLIHGENIIDLIGNILSPFYQNANKYIMGNVWRNLYKRELIIKNKISFPQDLELMEDYIFHIEALTSSNLVYLDERRLYNYFIEENSASTKYRENMYEIRKSVFIRTKNILEMNRLENKLKDPLEYRNIDIYLGTISNEFRGGNERDFYSKYKYISKILKDDGISKKLRQYDTSNISPSKKIVLNLLKYKFNITVLILYWFANKFR